MTFIVLFACIVGAILGLFFTHNSDEAMDEKRRAELVGINRILVTATFLISLGFLSIIENSGTPEVFMPSYFGFLVLLLGVGIGLELSQKSYTMLARSFTATGLILVTFSPLVLMWFLDSLRLHGDASLPWILGTALCVLSYGGSALLLKSQGLGRATTLSVIALFWSFLALFDSSTGMEYVFFLPLILLALASHLIYLTKAKWVPTCFRATIFDSYRAMPWVILGLSSFWWIVGEDSMIRSIVALVLVVCALLRLFLAEKNFLWLRLSATLLILSIVADLTSFTLSNSYGNEEALVGMSLAWTICFAAQAVLNLALGSRSKREDSEAKIDYTPAIWLFGAMGGVLFASWSTNSVFAQYMSYLSLLLPAFLAILFTVKRRQVVWLFVSGLALLILPSVGRMVSGDEIWNESLIFMYYCGLVFVPALLYLGLQKLGKEQTLLVTGSSAILVGFATIGAGGELNATGLGAAIACAALGLLTLVSRDKSWVREAALYSFALALSLFVLDVDGYTISYNVATQTLLAQTAWMLAFAFSYWLYERGKEKPKIRLGLTYAASLPLGFYLLGGGYDASVFYALIFVALQAAILVFSVTEKIKWLRVSSMIALGLTTFRIVFEYIEGQAWIIVVGFALVGFAGYRISRLNKKSDGKSGETQQSK